MFCQALPAYVASFALGVGVIAFAYLIITFHSGPELGSSRAPGPPPLTNTPAPGFPPAAVLRSDPGTVGKLLLEKAVSGQVDQQTLESFRQLPEFEQCQQCFGKCEEDFGGDLESVMRDCRRNCLMHCSERARSLMTP
jgi:hypothetical protein